LTGSRFAGEGATRGLRRWGAQVPFVRRVFNLSVNLGHCRQLRGCKFLLFDQRVCQHIVFGNALLKSNQPGRLSGQRARLLRLPIIGGQLPNQPGKHRRYTDPCRAANCCDSANTLSSTLRVSLFSALLWEGIAFFSRDLGIASISTANEISARHHITKSSRLTAGTSS
jgi:hypothetical protein